MMYFYDQNNNENVFWMKLQKPSLLPPAPSAYEKNKD